MLSPSSYGASLARAPIDTAPRNPLAQTTKTMNEKADVATIEIVQEDKGHVLVSKCVLPDPFDIEVVKLDVEHGSESRFRFRLGESIEGRISASTNPHYQQGKKHLYKSIYVVHRGWIAILTDFEEKPKIDIGFGGRPGMFYVEAPANKWYHAYLSCDVVFTYSSSDTETGELLPHEPSLPSENEILDIYAHHHGINRSEVQRYVHESLLVGSRRRK